MDETVSEKLVEGTELFVLTTYRKEDVCPSVVVCVKLVINLFEIT